MFRNKSVLTQTLLAVSIPLIAVFLLILFLGTDILRKGGESFAREIVGNFAEQISIRIEDRLAVMYTALNMTRRSLEAIDYAEPDAKGAAERVLRDMLLSSEGVYSSWFVFESEAFDSKERFIKSFVKSGRYVREINHITPAMLNDPEKSPWYDFPLRSGSNYFVTAERHDYGLEDGPVYRGTLSFPIMKEGVVVGCVGVDVLYRQLLNFLHDLEVMGAPRTMSLITARREVIYSTASRDAPVLVGLDDVERVEFARHPILRYASATANGRQMFICLAPINIPRSSLQTFLYIELPASALTARSLPLIRRLSLVTVLGFLALAAGICLIVRGIIRPVRELTRKADAIAGGDLTVDFGANGAARTNNEPERLRQALKKMLWQLGDLHRLKLAAVRSDLEREKMAEANAVKSRFFATMSHEIRTPMNAITGLSEMLLARPLGAVEREHVEDIRVSAASLLRIVNDILDTSKMEEGRFELRKEHFNLRAMLGNVDSVVMLMAKQKGLEYRSNLADAPEFAYGDPERLRQILLNLLSNAVKYTPSGKVVFVASVVDGMLRFVVSDTGMGIKEEDLPHVFEPYRRVAGVVVDGIEGSGLGLNITRQLVELMGGTVTARSKYGNGSVFKAEIPYEPGDAARVREATAAADSERVEPMADMGGAAILVVDDNPVNLKVARGFLRMAGIEADTAESGQEAIAMAGEREYDIIFMDHMMPGMDGVEAMRRICAQGGGNAGTTFIALTANVMGNAREELLREGMDDFLAKPLDLPSLRHTLSRWLSRDGSAVRKADGDAEGKG